MKVKDMLDAVVKVISGVKLGGAKQNPKLAELDRGILVVALQVAALDGTILPEEYEAFQALAATCRGGTPEAARKLLDKSLDEVGSLMAMAQVGAYTEQQRLQAFTDCAQLALPSGFAEGSMADLRRAFALWVAMGTADGDFSALEKAAINALADLYANVRVARSAAVITAMDNALTPAMFNDTPDVRAEPLLESDFFDKVEAIVRDIADPAKREDAEKAFADLIGQVVVGENKGKSNIKSASTISLALAAACLAVPV